ncbi:MAG: Mur ligase family protein [Oscillospiraceae bacterium]
MAAVQDRRALAEVSARLYRHPDRELAVVGVTGTNGKTTTTCLVRHILRQTLGVRVGLIGTIRNLIDETELETERTTPESCDVYRLLRQMADAGCRYGVMEVSSHALALERVWGITFRVGAFTNLTRDHLDFHRTMEDYCDAKAQLFRQCEAAVCNGDDPWTPRLLRECACPVLRYGTGDSSRLRGENLRLTARSVAFDALLDGRRIPVTVPIPGRFTVYNALAALGICHMLGVPPEQGAAALQTASGIKGRMEVVPTPGLPCTVLIDYAHTPDALENVRPAVRGFAEGRVVAVFGWAATGTGRSAHRWAASSPGWRMWRWSPPTIPLGATGEDHRGYPAGPDRPRRERRHLRPAGGHRLGTEKQPPQGRHRPVRQGPRDVSGGVRRKAAHG